MMCRKKSADHGFEVQAHWRPGERTPAWAELWRQIISEVLSSDPGLDEQKIQEKRALRPIDESQKRLHFCQSMASPEAEDTSARKGGVNID